MNVQSILPYYSYKTIAKKNNKSEIYGTNVQNEMMTQGNFDKMFTQQNLVSFRSLSTPSNVTVKLINDDSISCTMKTHFSYNAKSDRDNYIALFTTMLLIFLTPPYHSKESNIKVNKENPEGSYHNLCFDLPDDENQGSIQDILARQKELISAVYKTDFTNTLDGIKQTYIEMIEENKNLYSFEEYNEQIEIIKSISIEDVRKHMKKYLLNGKPVVYVKN